MKSKVKSILSAAAALNVLLLCTACGSSDAGTNAAELQKDSVQEVQLQADAAEDIVISDQPITEEAAILTKDQLYYRCMNTLEYLTQVSGSVSTLYGNTSPHIFEGECEFDFVNDIYHSVVDAVGISDPSLSQTNEYYNDGQECVTLCDYSGDQEDVCLVKKDGACPTMEHVTFANACPVSPADAEAASADGAAVVTSIEQLSEAQVCATYGADPTGAHEIATFFVPQEMTMGYLSDFDNWEITGTQEVQGRTCAVVQGTADPEYGGRLGVETFEILVDQETGVWMQYEGYAADGTVQSYVYTENIQFDAQAQSVPAFTASCAEGYSMEQHGDSAETAAG